MKGFGFEITGCRLLIGAIRILRHQIFDLSPLHLVVIKRHHQPHPPLPLEKLLHDIVSAVTNCTLIIPIFI